LTRLNLGSGRSTIPGFQNHDPDLDGWRFEDGLGQYPDESVEGITICHALMYLPLPGWPAIFAEFARVLEPGGVVRVQEDWTNHPGGKRYGGFDGAVTLATPYMVVEHMREADLSPARVDYDTTTFRDRTLIQRLHEGEPHSFAIEGMRPWT
jgi:hypothetical protein